MVMRFFLHPKIWSLDSGNFFFKKNCSTASEDFSFFLSFLQKFPFKSNFLIPNFPLHSFCRMWWTITGNFGNILPIDWSKSYTRKMHMPTLNLGQNTNNKQGGSSDVQTPADDLNSEDEAIANDLDMHALILHGLNNEPEEPIKSVEEVIKEIEYIIDEAESPTDEATTCESEVMEKAKEVLGAPLYAESKSLLFEKNIQIFIIFISSLQNCNISPSTS